MPRTRKRNTEAAHRQTVEAGIEDVAQFLEEVLGRRLVAFMVGASDPKAIGKWAAGERQPRPETEQRLRTAYRVFQLLNAEESPHTVRAWFIGLNPQLDEESPAQAIRESRLRDVVMAAKAYVAGG